MKASIKYESDTKVKITITVDSEELAIAEQVATKKLAKDVKVDGFRKGKVPLVVAAKSIDPNVLQDQTIENALSKAVADAFISNKIQALERPMVEVKKFVPTEMLEFTATAEILPEVKIGNYKKLKIKTEKVDVKDKEIDEIIERIRGGMAEKKEVKRAAKDGDEVVIDFIGKKDGVEFKGGTGNDFPLKLGSKQFIPGFEEGIINHKAGETFDLDLKFPDDYGSAELKGQKATFTTTIKSVNEITLPELTDKLAEKAGPFKTIAELRADIKRELTAQKERENSDKQKDDLIKQLVEISRVPVPEILVNDQTKSIEQDFIQNLMYQGITLDQYLENKNFESKEKWLKTEVQDVAIKRVKSGLVLAELSKLENIKITEEEIENQVGIYKLQYSKNPEALKQFELPEVRHDIANRLITEKTVNKLVELNK